MVARRAARAGPRTGSAGGQHRSQDQQHEEDDHERGVEHADRRDDPANRSEDGLRELEEQGVQRGQEGAAAHREPRQDRSPSKDDEVEGDQDGQDVAHGQGWKRPRAWSRSFSSWETSTLLGVSRNTWSATRCMEPATAYASPLEKSMRRRCSSRGRPCRLRITGWLALSRSPTSWASL